METQEHKRKRRVGVVVSNAMDKSAVVEVTRTLKDPLYKKYIRRKKKFMIHDEKNECKPGDLIEMEECRPMSKHKKWRLAAILKHEKLPQEINAGEAERAEGSYKSEETK